MRCTVLASHDDRLSFSVPHTHLYSQRVLRSHAAANFILEENIMIRSTRTIARLGIVAILGTGILVVPESLLAAEPAGVATREDRTPQDTKYERQAPDLEAKADRSAKLAVDYRARIGGGSKQSMTFASIANHYDREAKRYHQAALGGRGLAKAP